MNLVKQINKLKQSKEMKLTSIYSRSMITRTITLLITVIGNNLKQIIEEYLSFHFEGKCVVEGFIKPESTKLITYSNGCKCII